MKKLKQHLDKGFGVIMRGMEIIGTAIGDPPNPEKDDVKSDHPSTFEQGLREQEQQKNERQRR